jgi:murein DD-endopeptidase MepM/ murein hydrolase activator NlpD
MGKGIKTRETKQNIKVHDSAVNVADRVKNIGVKSKEAASESINQTDNVSPEQYASDKISDAIKSGTETAAVGTKKAVKNGAERAKTKIKEKVAERKEKSEIDETQTDDGTDSATGNESSNNNSQKPKSEKKTEAKQKPKTKPADKKAEQSDTKGIKEKENKPAVKEKTQAPPKQREVETSVEEVKKLRQRKQTLPKTKGKPSVKKVNAEKQTIKTLGSDVNKIKQTKRSLYNQNKAIKKANNKVKTAQRTAKTAKSTAKTSAEVAKRTKQTAQATAKATVKAVKVAAKAVVELGKATVEAVKSIGAIIAAGGVPAVVVIIVICLIGAIGGTCFGIFLSNDETTGTQKTMSQAISELTSEHYANLTAMKASYTYDLLEINGNTSINWKDVLAVYAVRTTSSENPLEVVTLDDAKMDILREIMEDMNTMTGVVTPKVVAETVVTTNENGEQVKTTQYVTKKVLTVTIIQLSKDEISELYNFNDEQKAQLDELMSEEFDELWADLLGASGQIIQGNSSFVGTGMFAWPFEEDQYISSRFGTRVDPISGEIKTHGGTDIAAPLGTPILAAADGVVVTATWHNSYGYYVKIKHDETYSTLYAHCSALHVSVGQTVKQGQVIADCGSTGYSTGPHCHFEVIQNGVRVDALRFYKVQ